MNLTNECNELKSNEFVLKNRSFIVVDGSNEFWSKIGIKLCFKSCCSVYFSNIDNSLITSVISFFNWFSKNILPYRRLYGTAIGAARSEIAETGKVIGNKLRP